MTTPAPSRQAEHNRQTRDAYDRLAAVWAASSLAPHYIRDWSVPLQSFAIDRIAEPQPSPEAIDRYPADLASISGIPVFVVYRLKLLAGQPASRVDGVRNNQSRKPT